MVYSTTSGTAGGDLGGRQALWAVLALAGAAVFLAVDYRLLLQYSPGLYGVAMLVLVGPPALRPGDRRGEVVDQLGGFQVQPSELARIAIALLLAWILENDDRAHVKTRTIWILAGAVGLPMLLVLLQPDTGVALTYVPFLLAALYFGGMRAQVVGDADPGRRPRRRRLVVPPEGLPEGPDPDLPRPQPRRARRRLPGAAGAHRHRLGRGLRQGVEAGDAEPPRLPPGPAHRLHLRGPGRGVGLRRRRRRPRALRGVPRPGLRARARRAGPGRVDARPPPRHEHRLARRSRTSP